MSNVWHPDDQVLIPWSDGELDTAEAGRIYRHLSECSACRERAAEIRALSEAVRDALPAPEPWPDLRSRLIELDAGQNVQKQRRLSLPLSRRWLAAAATILIGVLVIRLTTENTVSAAELLRDASAAEIRQPLAPERRIRVRTKNAVFVRPAGKSVESDVAHLFRDSGYNWEEPLSARSFAAWWNGLTEKDDRVRILDGAEYGRGRFYRLTTSTPAGVLAEVSITIRAEDLRAVHETFRFRNDEWVEVTEEPAAPRSKPLPAERLASTPGQQSGVEPAPPPRVVTSGEELRVVAALHRIGADLGEPVEIRREETRIVVSALALPSERRSQIQTALADLPFVELRFEQADAVAESAPQRTGGEAEAPKNNAFLDLLASRLGNRKTVENFTDHVLDLSDSALGRAHALRALAGRFPPDVERELPREDRQTLARIRDDHARVLLSSVRQLAQVLQPLGTRDAAALEPYASWQSGADSVLAAAQTADRRITNAIAGSGEVDRPDEALSALLVAASELQVRVTALSTTLAKAGAQQ